MNQRITKQINAINTATRLVNISNVCVFRQSPLLEQHRFDEVEILRKRGKKFEKCYKRQLEIVFGKDIL